VALTGAGHVLAARADELLEVLAGARADLERIGGAVTGPVRVASVASAAATVVSDALHLLRRERPGVEVSVRTAEPYAALEMLLADDVDLAVVDEYDYVPLALPDFVEAVTLCAEPLLLVTPAAEPAPRRRRLVDLAAADWVMPPEDAACGQAVRAACRTAGFEPRVRWETDDMLLLVRAVGAGHGIAVLPQRSIASGVAEVRATALREPALTRRLISAGRSSSLARPVVASVADALTRATRPIPARNRATA
jgi:DNA-binding transcriptional LysR family regulator